MLVQILLHLRRLKADIFYFAGKQKSRFVGHVHLQDTPWTKPVLSEGERLTPVGFFKGNYRMAVPQVAAHRPDRMCRGTSWTGPARSKRTKLTHPAPVRATIDLTSTSTSTSTTPKT